MRITVEGEHTVRHRIVDDGVSILGRMHSGDWLKCVKIEHHDGAVIARGREAVAGLGRDRGPVCAVNARHLADQRSRRLIDDHDAVGSADVDAMRRRVGHEIVPASRAAQRVRVRYTITAGFLRRQRLREGEREEDDGAPHAELLDRSLLR